MRFERSIAFLGAIVAGVALGGAPGASARGASGAVAPPAPPALRFSRGLTLVDANGASTGAAEPSIKVDGGGHVYVTGPAGVPTGGCPLWYIHPDTLNAHKQAYEYRGKFDTDRGAPGGGDCDIATGGARASGGFDNLAVSSLSLADITVNQSADGGATFHTPANPLGNQTPGDDRQWNTADTKLGQVYTTVHDVATDNIQISSSTDGGYTYVSNTPAIQTDPGSCGLPSGCFSAATVDNHFGNLVVNPKTHEIYTVYVAPANAAENAAAQQPGANLNEHVVYVASGNPCAVTCTRGQPIGPITWTDHVVYTAPQGDDLAHVFPAIAIDSAGAIYVTWSDTHRVFMTHSTQPDTDGTWARPVPVSSSGLHSAMFPWIVAGGAGKVDLVWYAAKLDPNNPACANAGEPQDDSQGVSNNCHNAWDVDFAQSRNATVAKPTFQHTDVIAQTIHNGSLCDQGTNCDIFGGDRTLLDFFQVALDPLGAANVAFASDIATPGQAQIIYSRQCEGLSATSAHSISYSCHKLQPGPPALPPSVCSGNDVITDPSGDAVNPTGAPASSAQADITDVSFATDAGAHTLTTTLTLSTLTAPPEPIAGTADTYYYVVWSFGGKTYATLASEPAPDTQAFSFGEFDTGTNQLTTSNPATGTVTAGSPGTISVTVPLSGIGNPTIPASTLGAAAVQHPYAMVFSGEGALGSGLVFVQPDDRAPNSGFGSAWSVC
jgi:hypothetical protein